MTEIHFRARTDRYHVPSLPPGRVKLHVVLIRRIGATIEVLFKPTSRRLHVIDHVEQWSTDDPLLRRLVACTAGAGHAEGRGFDTRDVEGKSVLALVERRKTAGRAKPEPKIVSFEPAHDWGDE